MNSRTTSPSAAVQRMVADATVEPFSGAPPGGDGSTEAEPRSVPFRPPASVVVGFWASAWFMVAVMRLAHDFWLAPHDRTSHHVYGALDDGLQYALWALLTPAIFWLSGRFPVTRRNWVRRVPMHFIVGLIVIVTTMLLLLLLHNQYAHYPGEEYHHPPGGTDRWSVADLLRYFVEYGSNRNHFVFYAGILTAGFAFQYYRRLQKQQIATERMRSDLVEARLQALRMQLHPHFLFNTLNTISNLTERDPRSARRVIARLSELLRRALDSTREAEIPLKEELNFADGYLEIIRERFADKVRIETVIDPASEAALVPNLILQPLLENAVEHGIARSLAGGWIRVETVCSNDRLHLRVSDNGPGIQGRDIKERVGLSNTRARLDQLYGRGAELFLSERDGGGTVAEIVLPYHTERAGLRRITEHLEV